MAVTSIHGGRSRLAADGRSERADRLQPDKMVLGREIAPIDRAECQWLVPQCGP
jgi:hypothetical protein